MVMVTPEREITNARGTIVIWKNVAKKGNPKLAEISLSMFEILIENVARTVMVKLKGMITSAKVTIAPYGNVAKRRNRKPVENFSSTCATQIKDATVMGMAKLARTTMNAMMNI
eukprot:Awhi_evm1s12619